MRVLVTGGAGYIGSHVALQLGERGDEVLTVDDLSGGNRNAVLTGRLEIADVGDRRAMGDLLLDFRPDAVMHFAASIKVEESVRMPLHYYLNNTVNTAALLELLIESGVRPFVFSSTAAVYGIPEAVPVSETAPLEPINPYGWSKAMSERMLLDLAAADRDFRYVSLRYFNVAGADEEGRLGQNYREATHLITRALKAAKGELTRLEIFGTDYDTPDGTCVRDYLHVTDLAAAHLSALDLLAEGGRGGVYNCGYGHGSSVREVIASARRVTGVEFPVVESGRRRGDAPRLVADCGKIKEELGWRPAHDDLDHIVETAWRWEQAL